MVALPPPVRAQRETELGLQAQLPWKKEGPLLFKGPLSMARKKTRGGVKMADLQTLGQLKEEALRDEPRFLERLGAKLEDYGRAISDRLRQEVQLVYGAFRDPDTPFSAKLTIAGALAYFIMPCDALPDLLPVLGFTDDAAVIAMAVRKLREIIAAHQRRRDAKQRLAGEVRDLNHELSCATRENARLRGENLKWRRVARCELILLVALSALTVWLALS